MSKQESIKDTIGDYRGRVRVVGEPSGIKLQADTGYVTGRDSENEDYYLIELDKPAIKDETGEQLLVLRESPDNLKRQRYHRNYLQRLFEEKGLRSGSYRLFWVTGEGEYFQTKPGYYLESSSGEALTLDGKLYSWWLEKDEITGSPKLSQWKETRPEPAWLNTTEYSKALRWLRRTQKKQNSD